VFRFAHKSFLEFFVARRIVEVLLGRARPAVKLEDEAATAVAPSRVFGFLGRRDYVFDDRGATYSALIRHYLDGVQGLWRFNTFAAPSGSEESIRAALGRLVNSIFEEPDKKTAVNSAEIATFALEYIDFLGASLPELLEESRSEEHLAIVADIIRLAKPTPAIRRERKKIRALVLDVGVSELLRVACCVAPARTASGLDAEIVVRLRAVLSPRAWRYLLLEVSESSEALRREVFPRITALPGIALIERLVAIWGMREDPTLFNSRGATVPCQANSRDLSVGGPSPGNSVPQLGGF
jgi:hypothetical protein